MKGNRMATALKKFWNKINNKKENHLRRVQSREKLSFYELFPKLNLLNHKKDWLKYLL